MKERPILFSAPMVRALLSGTKTQTRREVKPQPVGNHRGAFKFSQFCDDEGIESFWQNYPLWGPVRCPYGKAGDRLWVREAFCDASMAEAGKVLYRANDDDFACRWTPSIHMPRRLSRIVLEIVAVRVERLQDISENDAEAEGCAADPANGPTFRDDYRKLWESINGEGSWAANPWVWVIEFQRATP